MTMEDWAKRIDIILEAGGDAILSDAGKLQPNSPKICRNRIVKYRVIKTVCLARIRPF
jgi:hypothetical protein